MKERGDNRGLLKIVEVEYIYTGSSILPQNKGCVEYWWKPNFNYNEGGKTNYCRFWGSSGGYHGVNYGKIRIGGSYYPGTQIFTLIYILTDNGGYQSLCIDANAASFSAGDLVHVAFVWDVDRQIEGQYTLAIYQNGVRIGAGTQAISADMGLNGIVLI